MHDRRGLAAKCCAAMASPATRFAARAHPRFGGVHPEPIEPHIDACGKRCSAGKFDAGLCADGDGDRIGAIDRDGSFVNPHQSLHCSSGILPEPATCPATWQRHSQ